jgi:hypothetical protein
MPTKNEGIHIEGKASIGWDYFDNISFGLAPWKQAYGGNKDGSN